MGFFSHWKGAVKLLPLIYLFAPRKEFISYRRGQNKSAAPPTCPSCCSSHINRLLLSCWTARGIKNRKPNWIQGPFSLSGPSIFSLGSCFWWFWWDFDDFVHGGMLKRLNFLCLWMILWVAIKKFGEWYVHVFVFEDSFSLIVLWLVAEKRWKNPLGLSFCCGSVFGFSYRMNNKHSN